MTREARVLAWTRDHAADDLAGRTLWCACALPGSRASAEALRDRLQWTGEGVLVCILDVRGPDLAADLGRRLDEMLGGTGVQNLRPGDDELYGKSVESAESTIGEVRDGDLVIAHDSLTAALAQAVRARGAHTILNVTTARSGAAEAAHQFVRSQVGAMDAHVATARHTLTAAMPATGVVAVHELGPEEEVGWSALLADVINGDRHQTVGGTLHVRPVVAAR